eukprot:CAMPEP_0206512344 /NCGR_PEP_ID=MMETSP0324_2-20121206/60823_1 /ASSEMBLY_ACC=CAM_ASM_000836 /TAXON_ID=2866 /ORGANISM="Crypthecodinium cohnii, Strain Seligo" /LENGTH=394 /DNA_ID=CAMNT_0054004283 /DNA_START=182 /DNA_END=1362 /DNA_ORIENTATION=-
MPAQEFIEPQVVHVVHGDGDTEIRLADLQPQQNALVLRQVSMSDEGEVTFGGSATITLSSIGSVDLVGQGVQLRPQAKLGQSAKDAPVLMELRFEGTELARRWAEVMDSCKAKPKPGGVGGKATASAPKWDEEGKNAAFILKKLIVQQEEQVKLLEALNARKAEQLLACQERLEGALTMLQQGQMAYEVQQKVLDAQQQQLEALKAKAGAAGAGASSSSAAAAAATAAAATAKVEEDADQEEDEEEDEEEEEEEQEVNEEEEEKEEEELAIEEEEEEEEEEEVMLLQRLRALESEKERCEAELQRERAGVVSQLGELQGLVEELGGYDMLPDSLKAMLAAVELKQHGSTTTTTTAALSKLLMNEALNTSCELPGESKAVEELPLSIHRCGGSVF